MKQQITHLLASVVLILAGLALTAQAQSAAVLNVSIPFAFSVGNQTFPAGDYSLVQPEQHFMVLRDSRRNTIAQVFTSGTESHAPAKAPSLKFYLSDGRYVLTEIWQQSDPSGERLYQTQPRTIVSQP